MCAYSEVMGKDGEVEAAEVQILSEWNLLRRICLASAMRGGFSCDRDGVDLSEGC
jgi:hypothetical protein